jgi:hypothetical protein
VKVLVRVELPGELLLHLKRPDRGQSVERGGQVGEDGGTRDPLKALHAAGCLQVETADKVEDHAQNKRGDQEVRFHRRHYHHHADELQEHLKGVCKVAMVTYNLSCCHGNVFNLHGVEEGWWECLVDDPAVLCKSVEHAACK